MSMVFKKLQNKILVHMKTFDKAYVRILDRLLGREKHLSVFFPNSLYERGFTEYLFVKTCIKELQIPSSCSKFNPKDSEKDIETFDDFSE